jgi:hypothetical protein
MAKGKRKKEGKKEDLHGAQLLDLIECCCSIALQLLEVCFMR